MTGIQHIMEGDTILFAFGVCWWEYVVYRCVDGSLDVSLRDAARYVFSTSTEMNAEVRGMAVEIVKNLPADFECRTNGLVAYSSI